MKPGGRRRVLVRPERGWREETGACAAGSQSLTLDAAQRTTAQDGNLVFKAAFSPFQSIFFLPPSRPFPRSLTATGANAFVVHQQ